MWIEPEIHNYFDALWYCFSVISTIGFGDIVGIPITAKNVNDFIVILYHDCIYYFNSYSSKLFFGTPKSKI